MSFELILEVPSSVVKVIPIDESINSLGLKSSTVLLLKTSITVINSETGHVYRNFEPLKGSSHSFIDCVYLRDSKSFLAAVSDSSLILIPEYAKKASDYQRTAFPFLASSVHCFNGRDVIVNSSSGHVCQFTVQNDNSFPKFESSPKNGHANLFGLGNSHHFSTLSSSSIALDAPASSKKSKKSVPSSSGSGSNQQLILNSWSSRTLLEGSSVWLNESDNGHTKSVIPLQTGETLIAACAHRHVDSFSLIVSGPTATRWVKVNVNGDVLIERPLTNKPRSIVEVGDHLWMIHDLSRVTLWDIKFGVEVQQFTIATSAVVEAGVGYILPYGYTFNPDGDSTSSGVAPCHLLVSVAGDGGASTSLYRHTLTSETQTVRSTLCSAIGKMASGTACSGAVVDDTPFNVSIYDDSNQPVAVVDANGDGSAAVSGRVLAGLPGPMKRKLKQIQTLYDNQVKLELSEMTSTTDMDSPEERFAKRYRRFYLDIPDSVSRAFLTRLESAEHSDLQASDWDLVKVLIRSGTLSLASNPSLIQQATLAHRFDVLAQIVRYVSDLTEKQCVRILRLCLYVSDNSLARLNVVHGIIQWGNNGSAVSSTSKPEEKSGLVSIESLASEPNAGKGKTPKKKAASRASAKDFFTAEKEAAEASSSAAAAVDKMVDAGVVEGGDKRSIILRAMIESVVHRSSAFSSVLLSEAVRSLSPSMCALFLRLFSHTLRGLSVPVNESKQTVHLGAFGDDQIKRAITWIEALLDGNFSAIALHASVHAPTRRALSFAMKAVSQCDEAVDQVESALGLWTHISRVIYNGSEQPKPIPGLYQVEQLSF